MEKKRMTKSDFLAMLDKYNFIFIQNPICEYVNNQSYIMTQCKGCLFIYYKKVKEYKNVFKYADKNKTKFCRICLNNYADSKSNQLLPILVKMSIEEAQIYAGDINQHIQKHLYTTDEITNIIKSRKPNNLIVPDQVIDNHPSILKQNNCKTIESIDKICADKQIKYVDERKYEYANTNYKFECINPICIKLHPNDRFFMAAIINIRKNKKANGHCKDGVLHKRRHGLINTEENLNKIREKVAHVLSYRNGVCLTTIDSSCHIASHLEWMCNVCGHKWKTSISNIYNNNSWCPICGEKRKQSQTVIKTIFEELFGRDFKSCRPIPGPNGRNLELDGYNEEIKLAFEFNGAQHYQLKQLFHKNDPIQLEKQQERDKLKVEWCKNNNISLIVIPYTELRKGSKHIKEYICEHELVKPKISQYRNSPLTSDWFNKLIIYQVTEENYTDQVKKHLLEHLPTSTLEDSNINIVSISQEFNLVCNKHIPPCVYKSQINKMNCYKTSEKKLKFHSQCPKCRPQIDKNKNYTPDITNFLNKHFKFAKLENSDIVITSTTQNFWILCQSDNHSAVICKYEANMEKIKCCPLSKKVLLPVNLCKKCGSQSTAKYTIIPVRE